MTLVVLQYPQAGETVVETVVPAGAFIAVVRTILKLKR